MFPWKPADSATSTGFFLGKGEAVRAEPLFVPPPTGVRHVQYKGGSCPFPRTPQHRRNSLGPWRVTFTQNFFSNGPRCLAFTPPASPTDRSECSRTSSTSGSAQGFHQHSVQRPTAQQWQLSQQEGLSWRPRITTEGASALRPAAARVAVRSTAARSSLTIQDCPSRTPATGGPASSSGSSRG